MKHQITDRTYAMGKGMHHSTIQLSGNRVIDTDKLTDDQYKRALVIGLSVMVELGEIRWGLLEIASND